MPTITSEIIIAYSQCPRKAYLLLFEKEEEIAVEYIEFLKKRKQNHQEAYLKSINTTASEITLSRIQELEYQGKSYFSKVTLQFNEFQARCDLLCIEQIEEDLDNLRYEPRILTGTYSVTKEQKLNLLFIGYLLEKILKLSINKGKIISLDNSCHTIKLNDNAKLIKPLINPINKWIKTFPSEPPPVILNKHCPYCQFQVSCREKAEQNDDLSLLTSITAKSWQKYHKRGILTIKQLSYLYKPKKQKRNKKNTFSSHKPEIQALAIRTGKIYLQDIPLLSRQEVEIFLDIEGIPDEKIYYLIGVLIFIRGQVNYTCFWADNRDEEDIIWLQFMERINFYPEAPIYHYGSYEAKAIKKLSKNHLDEDSYKLLEKRLININQYIYGKVYFPVYSNSLKDLGKYVGASWSNSLSSGLKSLVFRYHWEENRNTQIKQILINYNQEDCQALKLLTDVISSFSEIADTHENIDFVNQPKKIHTERGELVHRQFEIILETAHRDYDRNKISLRLLDNQKTFSRRKKTKSTNASRPSKQFSLKSRQPDLSVEVNPLEFCPIHCNELKISKYLSFKTIIDLIFSNNGVTKKVIRYFGNKSYCFQCKRYYSPPDISKYTTLQMYDRGFKIWIVYHRVSLKLPNRTIVRAIKEQFGESITSHTIRRFIKSTADDYVETETALIKNMLRSSAIYVDETPINIQGENWYVWVFTDGIRVVFKLTETRESAIVKETLSDFQGVLVSDFYPGYDSLEYQQQKCWVHLIRDINNDLWKFPFDREYEELVLAVRDLIIPIFKTIESYGLKSNKLIKYKSNVDEFYQRVIVDHYYQSELSIKYQKRFLRYRNSLFTFLEKDKVKWHNNMAENAIRHLAKQREISVTFSKSLTPSYLRLLGIMQTCRYQNKSFLKFLQSEKKDIDKFKIFI